MRMKSDMYTVLVAASLLLFSPAVHADGQGTHEHKTPHGGEVLAVEDRRVELVVDSAGMVKVFVYDQKLKPLPVRAVQGSLLVTSPDSAKQTVELKESDDHTFLTGRLKDAGHGELKAILSLSMDGKTRNLRFSVHH